MPLRIGGSFTFVPSLWFGRETYDDSEKRVGTATYVFEYKSTLRGGPGARLAWSFADDRFDLGATMRLSLLNGMYFFSLSFLELSVVF